MTILIILHSMETDYTWWRNSQISELNIRRADRAAVNLLAGHGIGCFRGDKIGRFRYVGKDRLVIFRVHFLRSRGGPFIVAMD